MMGFLFFVLLAGLAAAGIFGMGTTQRSEPATQGQRKLTEAEAIEGLKARYLNGEIGLEEFEDRAEQIYAGDIKQPSTADPGAAKSYSARRSDGDLPDQNTDRRDKSPKRGGHGCRR